MRRKFRGTTHIRPNGRTFRTAKQPTVLTRPIRAGLLPHSTLRVVCPAGSEGIPWKTPCYALAPTAHSLKPFIFRLLRHCLYDYCITHFCVCQDKSRSFLGHTVKKTVLHAKKRQAGVGSPQKTIRPPQTAPKRRAFAHAFASARECKCLLLLFRFRGICRKALLHRQGVGQGHIAHRLGVV